MDRCPKCGWHHTDECMGENMAADHNPAIPRTRTPILVSAMRLLAQEIQSEDGVANAAIAEAGNRLSELEAQLAQAQQGVGEGITRPHDGPERCPTYYDGCNCTVEVLVHNIERAQKAEARVAELEAAIRWACGESDDGFQPREPGQGAYWWRTELRERAKLPFDMRFHVIEL